MPDIASLLLDRLDSSSQQRQLVGNSSCLRDLWSAGELAEGVRDLACGLMALNLSPGSTIGLMSDNADSWLLADLASLLLGLTTVPRARDTAPDEIAFILRHSRARAVFLQDADMLDSLEEFFAGQDEIRDIIILRGETPSRGDGLRLWSLKALLETGRRERRAAPRSFLERLPHIQESDLATIVYTSGTTGNPKGVRLTHGNILHNLRTIPQVIHLGPRDRFLSFLPTWHSFERTLEYCLLQASSSIIYSSRVRLRRDLPRVCPTIVAGVPRLWESMTGSITSALEKLPPAKKKLVKLALGASRRAVAARRRLKGEAADRQGRVEMSRGLHRLADTLLALCLHPCHLLADRLLYNKLRQSLGGSIRFLVSGGGALQHHVDELFGRAGICILNGYGLTETAPVLSLRTPEDNVLTTAGRRLPETEWCLRLEDGHTPSPLGARGILWVRGPQVMDGYHRNEEATRAVLRDGWFCTGDLARFTNRGHVIIEGRVKDTIVLRGGENVEPERIEAPLAALPLIQDILLVGHGEKHLAALVLPDEEALQERLPDLKGCKARELGRDERVGQLIHESIQEALRTSRGFRSFEQVPRIALLSRPFCVEDGTLTLTFKKRRPAIEERYQDVIHRLFADGAPSILTGP